MSLNESTVQPPHGRSGIVVAKVGSLPQTVSGVNASTPVGTDPKQRFPRPFHGRVPRTRRAAVVRRWETRATSTSLLSFRRPSGYLGVERQADLPEQQGGFVLRGNAIENSGLVPTLNIGGREV